jgi:hypothetical protein
VRARRPGYSVVVVSLESALMRAGSGHFHGHELLALALAREEVGGPGKREYVSVLNKYDIANAGAGGRRPWKEKKKCRAQNTTKRNGRRRGKISHLLFNETRLPLGGPGDVRPAGRSPSS